MNQDNQWTPQSWHKLPRQQQPQYSDQEASQDIINQILQIDAPISLLEIQEFRKILLQVSRGEKILLQIGDCAEVFDECTEQHWNTKFNFYRKMGDILDNCVVVGRVCGQFAKPRSQLLESDGTFNYRGDLINSFNRNDRVPDPQRMLQGAKLAQQGVELLKQSKQQIYISHESLHLLYESAFIRKQDQQYFLSNAHLPWLGDRTRLSEQAHVNFACGLANPFGVKIGTSITQAEFISLVQKLNPNNEEGKLFGITRFGSKNIAILKDVVEWKQQAKLQITFVCDPMHGNTETVDGIKVRKIEKVKEEIKQFVEILQSHNEVIGGIHLEATPYEVNECSSHDVQVDGHRYTTCCDPRLNGKQTEIVVQYLRDLLNRQELNI